MGYSPWGCKRVGHDLANTNNSLPLNNLIPFALLSPLELSTRTLEVGCHDMMCLPGSQSLYLIWKALNFPIW